MNVRTWLKDLGLAQHAELFEQNDIDAEVLSALTEADLSRTRFPWTQNWLNRSVQGGPEHDR